MCLLIFKPAGIEIPRRELRLAHQANPDGAGIAYATGRKTVIRKSAKWDDSHVAKELAALRDAPTIVHFRFATHGKVNYGNAHPFALPRKWAAAHNGVIHDMPCGKDESDTRAFLRLNVAPILTDRELTEEDTLALGKAMGLANKMTFLSPSGAVHIANEPMGDWIDGVWYSNRNHDWTPSKATRSRYASAAADCDEWEWERGYRSAYASHRPIPAVYYDEHVCAACLTRILSDEPYAIMDDYSVYCSDCA